MENQWPKPRHTRHVWIRSDSTLAPPVQGYVLEWRRHNYKWSALVFYAKEGKEEPTVYVQQWFAANRLWPVKADPNGPSPFAGY